jgi:DNA repair exonuclease SbcCD ATPase subunit
MGERTRDVALNSDTSAADDISPTAPPEVVANEDYDTRTNIYTPATGVPGEEHPVDKHSASSKLSPADADTKATEEANLSVEELKDRIEQTRSELGETVDAIQDRLDPERIKAQVREATIGKVQETVQTAGEKAQEVAGMVKEKAQELAGNLKEKAEQRAQASDIENANRTLELDGARIEVDGSISSSDASPVDAAQDKLEAAKTFVKNNPLPVAAGAAATVALWLWRRRNNARTVIEYDEYEYGCD